MFFVNYLRLWDKEDALHLAPSDEFYNLFQGNQNKVSIMTYPPCKLFMRIKIPIAKMISKKLIKKYLNCNIFYNRMCMNW